MKKKRNLSLRMLMKVEVLSTRETANVIRQELEKAALPSEVYIDFSDITQISRSFADAVLKLRKDYQEKNVKVRFVYLNDFNKKMLELVEHQAKSSKPVRSSHLVPSTVLNLSQL